MRKLPLASALLAATAALSACGGVATNHTVYSQHQPVVEKNDYSLDVSTSGYGLAYGEQARVAGWFQSLGLKYGDHVVIDDPAMSAGTRDAIAEVAAGHGLVLDEATVQTGTVPAGTVRITISRARAYVPGCPDWSAKSDFNPGNATYSNYGCATNANLAAMVADPQDLIHGQTDTGSTAVMTSNKAVSAYRNAPTTGNGNKVSQTGTRDN